MKKEKKLKKISARKVAMFRIANRKGIAAVCERHLTEGKTAAEAFSRMEKALKRSGYELSGKAPKPKG